MTIQIPSESHSRTRTKIIGTCCSVVLLSLLVACGSGSDSADVAANVSESTVAVSTELAVDSPLDVLPSNDSVDTTEPVPIDPEQADLFENADTQIIGDETATDEPFVVGAGNLIPIILPSETGVDPRFAQSSAAMVLELNESLILPADIDVNFVDCGTANAFFVPGGSFAQGGDPSSNSAIFMCHELTELFSTFFGDDEQAFSASVFVLMHELGHAFVEELSLPVLGIEESYVDGVAAVLLGESGMSEGSALAGWFFGSQPNTPFSDSHRANPQRLGDLVCWGIGADPTLLEKPLVNSIFQQLVVGGRNCVAEYAQQVAGLTDVLGSAIQGGLAGALVPAEE